MPPQPTAARFAALPRGKMFGRDFPVATRFRARLLGLALLDRRAAGDGLLIPRCSSVHTFGMRFALDLVFLDDDHRPLAVHREVGPRRIVSVRGASAVLEVPSSLGGDFSAPSDWGR